MKEYAAEALASDMPRARALAEAARARAVMKGHLPQVAPWEQMIGEMEAMALAMPVDWPPVERIWFEFSVGLLEQMLDNKDVFLHRFLRIDAQDCPASVRDQTRFYLNQQLVYVLLSVGDLEGAYACSVELLASAKRIGLASKSIYYNHLLTLGTSGRFDEAQALMTSMPELRQPEFWTEYPGAQTVVHWCDAHAASAPPWDRAWIEREHPIPERRGSAAHANLVWMLADLCNLAGQPARAARMIGEFLESDAGSIAAPSLLNGTMLYQTLSQALEALGDVAGALGALRKAQEYAHTWTLQGAAARLQALHLAAPGAQPAMQERRVSSLRQLAVVPPPAPPERQLVAYVSHEIRNPLNGVLGMIGLLGMSKLDDQQRRQLQLAATSARMALTLCNDLLDLAKIDAGRLELNPTSCELAPLLDEVVQNFMPIAQSKGLPLILELDPALPREVWLDRLRLQQVLMNLVSNAVKFTARGQVVLAVRLVDGTSGECLRIEVTDTGVGLTTQERSRLFQEFSQAHAGVAAQYGGTGLGLALSYRLVMAMGGRIDVESSPGRGSRFWFEVACEAGSLLLT